MLKYLAFLTHSAEAMNRFQFRIVYLVDGILAHTGQ